VKRVLRRIFGAKRYKVNGEWRKLHNYELSVLYSSPCIFREIKSRRTRWAGHVACMGERIGLNTNLVGRPEREREREREGERPLGRPRLDRRIIIM
jgi:hypothetical protein